MGPAAVANSGACRSGTSAATPSNRAQSLSSRTTIAIHSFTASSPGEGIGLAVNFLPAVVGVGAGLLAERMDLDPRPALGFHGAVIGGLSMLALTACADAAVLLRELREIRAALGVDVVAVREQDPLRLGHGAAG